MAIHDESPSYANALGNGTCSRFAGIEILGVVDHGAKTRHKICLEGV